MPRKHLALVVHGARADRPDFRHLVSWVRDKGHLVEVHPTWEAGAGTATAAAAAHLGVDAVVAVGGDGTVNEVVNGLDGYDTPLGIIPLGTANDFARQVGIPPDADHAMDVVLLKPAVRMDTLSLNGRRFLNVSSGGMGAEATAETPSEAKASLGPVAYAITGMRKLADFESRRARFEGEGFRFEGDVLLFTVGNARATGAGTLVAPRASVTDGALDLCIVESMPRRDFARVVLSMKRGEHLEHDRVHYVQLREVLIESAEALSVNVDGEHAELTRLYYRARPSDLRVHVHFLPGMEE
ncbi:MAG TPA: YegS/Rv2252/BmrU family lipid kinase [Gemmatimonadaceae bacterium]|nr:YegS/Rv2252/BmrU family lipid kinase [Gemmatimonadaceae bacterium]